ncbi:MAG: hypothetical protein U1F43_06695 [Myxococcota bacterium]
MTINNSACTAAMPFAPWSGRKESGTGVTNSPVAILEMVTPKFVLIDKNADPEVWWFPLSEEAVALARRSLEWLTAEGLGKLSKTFGLLGAMKKRVRRAEGVAARQVIAPAARFASITPVASLRCASLSSRRASLTVDKARRWA